ncbi:MAG: ATP-binding protein [Candidatus Nanoperiomorbaceae bacterium]
MSGDKALVKNHHRQNDWELSRATQLISGGASLVMAIYTGLSLWSIVPGSGIGRSLFLIWGLILIFITISGFEFFVRCRKRSDLILMALLRYTTLSAFTSLIAGDQTLTYALWLVLLVISGLTLGWRWLVGGGVWLLLTSLVAQHSILTAFDVTISAVIVSVVAALIIWLRRADMVPLNAYNELATREKLGQHRLETIINSITDAVVGVDSRGKINFYNAALLSLIDTNRTLTGRYLDEFFHLIDADNKPLKFAKLMRKITQPTEKDDLRHVYPDGQKINLLIEFAPVREVFRAKTANINAGFILIIRDITKQKSLDDERDEFIAVMSHELRTPVAIAEGALSNLQILVARQTDPKTFGATLNSAHDQILYLGQMVNDLSTLSRAQRGVMMEPEVVNIGDFADELYKKYLPEATERKLKLDLDVRVSGEVRVSRMAIEEIMQNLIVNALKYTRQGGIDIVVQPVPNDNNKVEFAVKDTGIGISISDQKHVFERFWRSEDYRTRETNGTGLGLSIVDQLAHKINTVVELRSRLNYGSTFSFQLPLFAKSKPADTKTINSQKTTKKS